MGGRETSVAEGVMAMRGDYDAAVKRLLSERQVISRVLQGTLPEFAGLPPWQIERDCLVGNPDTGRPLGRDVPTMPEQRPDPGRVLELATEDHTSRESNVLFDVRTHAWTSGHSSDAGMRTLMEIDLEGQRDASPGYPLLCRAIYYAGRMLSQQGAGPVRNGQYDRLRKVATIWVCTRPLKGDRATVRRFELGCTHLLGRGSEEDAARDKIAIVMVCLGPGSCEAGGVVGMLGTLFAADLGAEEKLALLHNKYGMIITERIAEEVGTMTDIDRRMCELYDAGEYNGEKKGRFQTLVASVRAVMNRFDATLDDALDTFDVTGSERAEVVAAVQETS